MSLSLHSLKPAKGAKQTAMKRVGRGNSSGKGTTAGRGTKGQKARTGGRNKLNLLGLRRLVLSTPKLRGFTSQHKKDTTISLDMLGGAFRTGEFVTPATLAQKGIVPPRTSQIKIVSGRKTLQMKLVIKGCAISSSAKDAVVAAGGEIR
jgi:large subunit ribosomal protein L15